MSKFRFTITIFVATLTLAFASSALAQATRTWVSGVGDDANPCSRTAPCKTFAGAISKTAPSGEIDVLDPGGFGALTITKAITIDGGQGQVAGVLVSGTNGIVVSAGSNDIVTLRNLDIDGLNTGVNGILINGGKAVHIDHCQVYDFASNGILDSRTGPSSPTVYINDSFIRGNAEGITITGSAPGVIRASIDHCRIQDNAGWGVAAANGDFIAVSNSVISGNVAEGVRIDTSAQVTIVGCVITNNILGLNNIAGLSLALTDSTLMNNATGFSGTITTFGNNTVRSNGGSNTLPAATPLQ